MEITFPRGAPAYRAGDLTIAFPVMLDGEQTECLITAEALEDHFGAESLRAEDLLDAFLAHRAEIERTAIRMIELTGGGSLVLRSGYFRYRAARRQRACYP